MGIILIVSCLPALAAGPKLKTERSKIKKTKAAYFTQTPYTVILDTVSTANGPDVHSDTILHPQFSYDTLRTAHTSADTVWQNDYVYTVQQRTTFTYDYTPTDKAWNYSGKVRLCKPYPFFETSNVLNKPRVGFVSGTIGGLYAAANAWWSSAWYSKYDKDKFHFFNDWSEWNQMDKLAHGYNAYFISSWTYDLFHWAGVSERHAPWIGMLNAQLWQLSIEVNDGLQKKWGFSWGDIALNMSGSLLFGIQQYWWHDQRIQMKISAVPVDYGQYGPEVKDRAEKLYGTSFTELILKDYNAMTFWLSASPGSFIKKPDSKFPKWLQVSFGYGASGMLGGIENKWSKNDPGGDVAGPIDPADLVDYSDIERVREFYLSFDVDWTRIPAKRAWARTCLGILNIVKLPFPAVEFNNSGGQQVKWHWLKF